MEISKIAEFLEKIFPVENAMDYDNVGLLVGDDSKDVKKIVLTLDCTSKAIDFAKENEADMIISHHPIIFGGLKKVTTKDPTGKIVNRLIKEDIACYAAHTNLDCTDEFGNTAIAKALGGVEIKHLEGTSCGVVFEPGYVNYLTLDKYAKMVMNALQSSGVITINAHDNKISKVFAQGGAFDEDSIPAILEAGVDVVISGEIKHHLCVMLEEYGVSTIIAGHSATEQVYLPELQKKLEDEFKDVEILVFLNNEKTIN